MLQSVQFVRGTIMRQSIQDMVKNDLSPVPPAECAFKTGDTVTFTNEYGVKFEGLTVIGFEKKINPDFLPNCFIYLNTSCYWFPKSPESLTLEHRHQERGE